MSIRISRVYTRTGDAGSTHLAYGKKISKASLRVSSYGDVDELGGHLGHLVALLNAEKKTSSHDVVLKLVRVQQELFDLGSLLAAIPEDQAKRGTSLPEHYITRLESEMDAWNERLPVLKSFILAGGTVAASYTHVCRTVCRRAERQLVQLLAEDTDDQNAACLRYLNRLSDYLFVLGRYLCDLADEPETLWDPERTAVEQES